MRQPTGRDRLGRAFGKQIFPDARLFHTPDLLPTKKLAVMLPFWIDCTASSLSTLLTTLVGTVTVLISLLAASR